MMTTGNWQLQWASPDQTGVDLLTASQAVLVSQANLWEFSTKETIAADPLQVVIESATASSMRQNNHT